MKVYLWFVWFGILVQTSLGGVIQSSVREDKVLPLPFLAVVSFPNVECTAGNTKGVCYSKKQCKSKGGVELGSSCAQGYGVCCSFSLSCPVNGGSVVVKTNLTKILGNSAQSCNFIIPKQKNVCQIRLDFDQFQLGDYKIGPVTNPPGDPTSLSNLGSCTNDKLMISPTQNLPDGMVICGSATNQHLYLHYGDHEKITLSLTQMTMGTFGIKLTMIKCDSLLKAPQGCTQYFREKANSVMSFNYPNMQLNSQRYSVCIDNNDGGRQIRWNSCTVPSDGNTSFFISGMAPPEPQLRGSDCVTDYIIIPGSGSERYCGGSFTGVEESRVTPFSMWVNFDEAETPKELMPSNFIDRTTGCPLGFTCSLPQPEICKAAQNGQLPLPTDGTCFPPPGYALLIDNYNIGFCLKYIIAT